jgi:signal transduction histidine kinase/CheY-like chemotaxis protein
MSTKKESNFKSISGDELVARASFGTQIGVSTLIGLIVLILDPKPIYFVVLLFSIVGSIFGYALWTNGKKRLATILGTGGLIFAGIFSHFFLGSVGGPTGILFLASVITAGGLGGRLEASITSLVVLVAITLGYIFYPTKEVILDIAISLGLLDISPEMLLQISDKKIFVPESILLSFVGFSIPCWGAYVVALDTSNRRARAKAEAALEERAILADRIQRDQRLESLVRVSGEVAHDFNNTLMVIAGNIDVLENNNNFPPEFARHLRMMKNATKISSGLTKKLLIFCQGKTTPPITLYPMQTIKEIVPLLEFTLRSKARLYLDIEESNRTMEISDGKLEQIILNLITNARDAIETNGEITVTMQHAVVIDNTIQYSNEKDATHIWIQVQDNGIGMSPAVQKLATEPFYSSKPSPHLGGLGLSIVKGIVVQSNGIMKLESTVGVGTTFQIALPLHKSSPIPTIATTQGKGHHILLIDDEPDVRYAVAMQLEKLGYSVSDASSFDEAIELLSKKEYRLLITDIRLKGESGFELIKRIRAKEYRLPVVFMTGFPDVTTGQYNDNEILLKPFTSLELQRTITKVLAQEKPQ